MKKDLMRHLLLVLVFCVVAALIAPGTLPGLLLWGPEREMSEVRAQEAGYLSSAGELAHEQNYEPITFNLAARWTFTHTWPKQVRIVNDSGGAAYIKLNAASLDVTTQTAHILLRDNEDIWIGPDALYPIQVRTIDFVLWDISKIYTAAIVVTAGAPISPYHFWAAGWW